MNDPRYMVMDPQTGTQLREATCEERAEYLRRNPDPTWERTTKVSTGALVECDRGYGLFFGGAGF